MPNGFVMLDSFGGRIWAIAWLKCREATYGHAEDIKVANVAPTVPAMCMECRMRGGHQRDG